MSRTIFENLMRDDGSEVTVEYEHGHWGGIIDVWPATRAYDRISSIAIWRFTGRWWLPRTIGECACAVQWVICQWSCRLTTQERERMEAWIAEHRLEDYSDEPEYLTWPPRLNLPSSTPLSGPISR
jgi:hypothetical protein